MSLRYRRSFAVLAIFGALVAVPVVAPDATSKVPVMGPALAPAAAHAAECHGPDWSPLRLCGKFVNHSDHGVGVVRSWRWDAGLKYDAILRPGQSTNGTFNWDDTDGIYVGPGFKVFVEGGGRTGWYRGDACTRDEATGSCKRGYHKFGDRPPLVMYTITNVSRI